MKIGCPPGSRVEVVGFQMFSGKKTDGDPGSLSHLEEAHQIFRRRPSHPSSFRFGLLNAGWLFEEIK